MNIPATLREYYVQRNVRILKDFFNERKKGLVFIKAAKNVAEKHNVSSGLIRGLVYDRQYPHGEEAWEIIEKEYENLNIL